MHASNSETAPTLSRGDGLVSHVLHSERDGPETDLTITWVEVDPGSEQVIHSHDPEQVYVIVAGEGRTTVGEETRTVETGDLVHVPTIADHGIENTGDVALEYVSAATPAVPMEEVDEFYEAQ